MLFVLSGTLPVAVIGEGGEMGRRREKIEVKNKLEEVNVVNCRVTKNCHLFSSVYPLP